MGNLFDSVWPRDAYGLFNTVTETLITGGAGATVKACDANISRVVLMIGANTATLLLTTDSGAVPGKGFQVGQNLSPLVLTWNEHGPLVTLAWFFRGLVGGANATVIEIVQERSPATSGFGGLYATPSASNDEQDDSPYGYVGPGVKPAPDGPDFLSAGVQQDYYKLWQACCAGRRRPTAVPGRTGGYFDSGGIWHAPTGER